MRIITATVVVFCVVIWLKTALNEQRLLNLLQLQNEREIKLEQTQKDLQQNLNEATQSAALRHFFLAQHSPLSGKAGLFYRVAISNHLDLYLLPAVAMAESGGCKQYIPSTNNCFGFGSGYINYPSIDDAIIAIGRFIGQSQLYKGYQKTHSLEIFAQEYNGPYATSYGKTLNYFVSKIQTYQRS